MLPPVFAFRINSTNLRILVAKVADYLIYLPLFREINKGLYLKVKKKYSLSS